MFCKRGIYVNWGNIPHLEFDFGPINLFSGGNGSGKTTAADGIQSLMTAAHENLFTYNPGQDETTQKGRGGKQVRTLASYVLGCDDGSFARLRPSDGYVAGVFHPTEGENCEPFTAVMCVRARLDTASKPRQARQDELLFLVLPGQQLSISDFVCEDSGGKYVVPINEIAGRLEKVYSKAAVESYDKKGPYLRRLYGALRGLKGAVPDREAKHAARTFSNFMAYKPVKSITEFVAREILEPKDLSEDIRQVSELMKTIHSMDDETRQLNDAIKNLEHADDLAKRYIHDWIELCVNQYCEATRQQYVKQQQYLKYKNERLSNERETEELEQKIQQHNQRKRLLHEQLIDLQAQRQGIDTLKRKDKLEGEIADFKDALVALVPTLLEQDHQFTKNHQSAAEIKQLLTNFSLALEAPELDKKDFSLALKELLATPIDTGLNAQGLLTKDWVGIGALEDKLQRVSEFEKFHNRFVDKLQSHERINGSASIRDRIYTAMTRREEQLEKARQQLKGKRNDIQQLKNLRPTYPAAIENALSAISQQCPQAKPSVLCDFVEITDPDWQMAIEGYIGGARFSIIVEAEHEADAIRIVRGLKGSRNNARVIQGAKVQRDAARITLPKGSIFEVMSFNHKVVEYYLKASYGSVIRVDNEKTLSKTARGLSAQGLGSGNYSMFRCDIDDAQLVFGQGARERSLAAQQAQANELEEQCQRLEHELKRCSQLYTLIESIRPLKFSKVIAEILNIYQQLQSAEDQIQNVDVSDHKALDEKLESLKSDFISLDEQSKSLSENRGVLSNKVGNLNKLIERISVELEALQNRREKCEDQVAGIAHIYPAFNSEEALKDADRKAESAKNDFNFEQDNRERLAHMDRHERQLYDAVLRHNQMSNAYNALAYFGGGGERNDPEFFGNIIKLEEQISGIYNSLKNNVLVGKQEQLSALKESFNTAFVTNLCHSIFQSINHGKHILDELNIELEHHRFGADQERFYFDYEWVPEFKEYWKFFKEIIDTPNLGDGSTLFDLDLSDKSQTVRDRLMSMLLDKDEQIAQRELKRISDYRNYRHYEIYKEPLNKEPIALSTYGTGSGGQLETPAYIIRSAAVTSAFKFNEGSSHCRMVLVDEAFSKMDESRSREVISYLTETLGLQLIFIMPTSKSGPFMDLISHQVVFSKCPTKAPVGELNTRVLVDRKVCNRDKIKDLWAMHRKTIRQQAMLDFMEGI